LDRAQRCFGLALDGSYDAANAHPNEMTLRIDHFLGRGHIEVERHPVPLPTAYGLRDALRAALVRVERDIVEAGGALPED
jgi:hypothetical protein